MNSGDIFHSTYKNALGSEENGKGEEINGFPLTTEFNYNPRRN